MTDAPHAAAMSPSMWTSYLVELPPCEMVSAMAAYGWRTCELSDEHGHDLLKMGRPDEVGKEFRRYAEDRGITFPQGHFYLCTKGIRDEDLAGRRAADIAPIGDDAFAEAMDAMARWVELFDALGVKAGVLHAGGGQLVKAGWSEDAVFNRRCQALSRIAEMVEGSCVTVCLENLGHASGVRTVDETKRLIEAVGSPDLAICLDTGHAQISGVDPARFVRDAGSGLKALHITDNLGQGDDHMLPYGKGVVDWPAVMAALHEIGYAGLFNFEVPGENRCPLPVRYAKPRYALDLAHCMIRTGDGAGND